MFRQLPYWVLPQAHRSQSRGSGISKGLAEALIRDFFAVH
jgi:hypothetical protein